MISERPEGRRAGFQCLVNCGSVWMCPVCAGKIASKRAEELAQVLDTVHGAGGSTFMLTLTIRHTAGDRPLRSAEDLSADYVAAKLAAGMHARWARKARQLGFDSSAEHGWDLRKTYRGDGDNIDSYFVKQAHEVTGGHRKEGRRRGGRTPMQLLADAVETYRVEDLTRWWVYEAVAEGRHQLEWSRGGRSLLTFAGLGTSQTDEQVAEETLDGEYRLGLPPATSQWLRIHGQHPALLDAAEHGGIEGAAEWLGRRSLTSVVLPLVDRASVRTSPVVGRSIARARGARGRVTMQLSSREVALGAEADIQRTTPRADQSWPSD